MFAPTDRRGVARRLRFIRAYRYLRDIFSITRVPGLPSEIRTRPSVNRDGPAPAWQPAPSGRQLPSVDYRLSRRRRSSCDVRSELRERKTNELSVQKSRVCWGFHSENIEIVSRRGRVVRKSWSVFTAHFFD